MRKPKNKFLARILFLIILVIALFPSNMNAEAIGNQASETDSAIFQAEKSKPIQLSTTYPIEALVVNGGVIQPTPPHAFTIGEHLRIYAEVISWKESDYLEVWAQINGGTGTVWDSDIEYGVSPSVSYDFYMDLDLPQNFEPGLTCLKIKRYDASGTFEETCYQIMLVVPQNRVTIKDVGITNPAYAGDKLYFEPVLWNQGSNDLDVKVVAEVAELGISRTEYLHVASGDQLSPGQRYLEIPSNVQSGKYNLTVSISYDGGQETKTYPFDIVNGIKNNNAPSLQDMPSFHAQVNNTIYFNLIGQDPDGDPIEFGDDSENCTTTKSGEVNCSFDAPGIYYEKFNVKDPWVENHRYFGFSISSPAQAQVDLAITDIIVGNAVAFEETIVEIVVSNKGWGGWTGGPAQFTLVVSDPDFDTPFAISGRSVVQIAQTIERIGPLLPGQSTSIKIPVVFKDAVHSKRLEVAMAGVSSVNVNEVSWSIFDLDQNTNNNVASIEGDDKFLVTESLETLDNCVFGPVTLAGQYLPLTGKAIEFLDDVHDGLEYASSTYEFYVTMSKSIEALRTTGEIALNAPTDAERIQATGKLLLSIHNLLSETQWENLYGLPSGTGDFAKLSLKLLQIANNEIQGKGCIALFPDTAHIVAGWMRSIIREIDFLAPDEKITYYTVESPADLIVTDGSNAVTSIGTKTQLQENIPFSYAFYSGEQKVIVVVDSNTNLSVSLRGTDTGSMTFTSLIPSAGADNTVRRYFNLPTTTNSIALLLPASDNTIVSDKNGDGVYENEYKPNELSSLTNSKITTFENNGTSLVFDFSQPGTIISPFIKIPKNTVIVGAFLSITGQKTTQFPQYPSVDLENSTIFNYPGTLSTAEDVEDFSDQLNLEIRNCVPDQNNNCTLSISVTSLTTSSIVLSNLTVYTLDSTKPADVTQLTLTPNTGFVRLDWIASTSADVAGYKVYVEEGNSLRLVADVGQKTTYTSASLSPQNYTFLVTTYDHALNESDGVTITGMPLENAQLLVVNEVDTGASDAVELYNPGGQAVDLSGWHLIAYDSSNTVDVDYTIPSGFILTPDAYVVIHENSGTNTATNLYIGNNPITWANENATGAVVLTDGTKGVDFVRFGNSTISPPTGTSWTGANPFGHPNRHTLGRNPSGADTNTGIDWCSQVPTLGAKNASCGIVGPVVYVSQRIDDDTNADPNNDSKGNNDGIANCGETVELYITLKNQGQVPASSVNATISTTDPYVTWLPFNKSSAYPAIPANNGSDTNTDDFDFVIAADTPNDHLIHFDYVITAATGGPWSTSFDVPVSCSLKVLINEVDTGASDAVELYNPNNLTVDLSGWHLIAYDSTNTVDVDYIIPSGFTLSAGTFVVVHETSGTSTTTDLYIGNSPISWANEYGTGAVVLTNGTVGIEFVRFGSSAVLPPGGTLWSGSNPVGHPSRHTLGRSPTSIDTDAGSDWCSQIPTLGVQNANCGIVGPVVYASQRIDDDTSSDPNNDSKGNNNGSAECGETVELYVKLKNQGQVMATGVSATISTTDPYVTWLPFNKNSAYPNLAASNGTGDNKDDFDFAIAGNTPNGHLIHFEYTISAGVGGPWSAPFDVPVTCKPIIEGSVGIPGVTITYTGGSTTSDNNGIYSFIVNYGWSGTVTPSKTGYNFNPANKSYTNVTANQIAQNYLATLKTYTLTVSKTGAGSGIVTSIPAGINCGATCSVSYDFNTSVTLTATPASGSNFKGWSGACSGVGPCMVTMNVAKSVTANFNSAPTNITLSNNTVLENQPVGTTIGTLSATDPDTGDTHTFTLACATPGANDTDFQISGNTLQTNAVFDYETKNSYSLCVRADDGQGGVFDKNFSITVIDIPGLELLKPANDVTLLTSRPSFDWVDYPAAIGYNIQISKNNTFTLLVSNANLTGLTNSIYIPAANLTPNTNMWWRVRAKLTSTTYSGWSEARHFITGNPPPAPTLSAPAANALVTSTTVKLDWNNVTVPAGTTFQKYEVQVATNSAFTLNAFSADVALSEYVFGPLSPNTAYYWRVRAYNTLGQYSAWSASRSLRSAILPPATTSPGNVVPGAAVNVNTRRPIFSWEAVNDATGYTLEVSTATTFATKAINATTANLSYTHAMDLVANTTFYWRVKANGANGPSAYSQVRTFKTGNPPSVPALASPANSALVTSLRPKFDWNNSTVPAGVTFDHYQIQVATSNTFALTVIEANTPTGNIASSEYMPAADLASATTYYWRVRSWNAAGDYSGWSSVRLVRIGYTTPVLLTPTNGSPIANIRPTFTWLTSGATSYKVQVSTVSNFSSFVVNATVYTNSYTMTKDLLHAKTYYWRVQALGTYGPSPWSLVVSFTTP